MGILDEILGSQEKKIVDKTNIKIETNVRPFRLLSKTDNSVDLEINIENESNNENLISVFVVLSNQLGFDRVSASKKKEIRLGKLQSGEVKRISVEIFANHSTEEGEHKLKVYAVRHYLDYDHIMEKFETLVRIRAV